MTHDLDERTEAGPRIGTTPTRRAAIFAVVGVSLLMSTLDGTIVATALHDLQHGLGTSVALAG